ncbi:MAG: phosphoenolpyruvate carboxykinase (GTP), partial [Thermoguttaceae bacterium]
MARLCGPDQVVWIEGSEQEKERLTREAVASGELIELNQQKLPGCVYHRTAVNDVARTEELTFICTRRKEDAGPTNNWMLPEEGYRRAGEIVAGSMKGRTMYVIPFSMGPVGSPFSKIGVELTDSIYVVLNMRIMTTVGTPVLKQLGTDGEFTKCLHGKADLDIKRRLILHFPEDNAIWSVGSGYGGNVLLGKKCLALRIASFLGRQEGWMAEHMLILGVESPTGRVEYVAAAFPSACGKTNLAMMVPPEGLRIKGYRVWTVGDDIAWMRIDSEGRLRAINPETGFFGVAPGTNSKSNPNMLKTIARNTIYTNVALGKDGTVWWEGGEGAPPAEAVDWQGRPWHQGMTDEQGKPIPGAHPNSRFTAPVSQCPSYSPKAGHPQGVPISAIIFGGRRAHVAPLVYESFNWQHGVFVGATMASERTAAQVGKVGQLRRDPMAMIPFCGYHMGDYFAHWLEMGKRMAHPPKIFHVNWFRTDENGKFLWPGYGENLRVIEWILNRCRGEADARETPIGYVPTPESIDLTGLNLSPAVMEKLVAVDPADWTEEAERVGTFFEQFGDRLPPEIRDEQKRLGERLRAGRFSGQCPSQGIKLLPSGTEIRPLAADLNAVIQRENPHVFAMLSDFGRRLYFPKGILAQSAEAKERAKRYNATIGIAREDGHPMFLPSVMRYFNELSPAEALTYAPSTGRPDLRKLWRDALLKKNPSLDGKQFSTPVV